MGRAWGEGYGVASRPRECQALAACGCNAWPVTGSRGGPSGCDVARRFTDGDGDGVGSGSVGCRGADDLGVVLDSVEGHLADDARDLNQGVSAWRSVCCET